MKKYIILIILLNSCVNIYSQNQKDDIFIIKDFIKSYPLKIDILDHYANELSIFQKKDFEIESIDTLFYIPNYQGKRYFEPVYAVKVNYDDSLSSTVKILIKKCGNDNKYQINDNICLDSIVDIDETEYYFTKDTNEVNYNYWLMNRIIENPDTIFSVNIIKEKPDNVYKKNLNKYLYKILKNYQNMNYTIIRSFLTRFTIKKMVNNKIKKIASPILVHKIVIEDKKEHKRLSFRFERNEQYLWSLSRVVKGDTWLFPASIHNMEGGEPLYDSDFEDD